MCLTVYWKAWTNILWASRDTASDTVAYCQEFIDTIMPAALAESTTAPVGIELLQLYISVRFFVSYNVVLCVTERYFRRQNLWRPKHR